MARPEHPEIDWKEIELVVYGVAAFAEGSLCLPGEGTLHTLRLYHEGGEFVLKEDPLRGKVEWKIRTHA